MLHARAFYEALPRRSTAWSPWRRRRKVMCLEWNCMA